MAEHQPGDKCPVCEGAGQYLMRRDLHRSEGWVPCQFSTGKPHPKWGTVVDLRCVRGTLQRS